MPESYDPPLIAPDPSDEDGLAPPPDEELLPTIEVADDDPAPLGRSWLFDLGSDRFTRSGGMIAQTRGAATLIQWIDKALHTERGGLPIHPAGYGLRQPLASFGQSVMGLSQTVLERDLRDCLTFHPRIVDVTNVQIDRDPMDEAVAFSYTVVLDPPLDDADVLNLRTRLA